MVQIRLECDEPNDWGLSKNMTECYFCGEKKGVWCKICREVLCNECHKIKERLCFESDWLSPHQYYESEFLGVKL